MKLLPALAAVLLGGLLFLAPGCSSDNGGGDGGNNHLVIDLRNGTWEVTNLTAFTGEDPECDVPDEMTTETDTLCAQDVGDFVNDEDIPISIDCTFDEGEGTFGFDCSGSFSVSGCKVTFQFEGTGQYTETGFSVTVTSVVQAEGSDPECVAPDCVITSTSTGTWKSTEGAETCADSATGPPVTARVPAEALVRSALSRVLR